MALLTDKVEFVINVKSVLAEQSKSGAPPD
jgi:hypothetical protein